AFVDVVDVRAGERAGHQRRACAPPWSTYGPPTTLSIYVVRHTSMARSVLSSRSWTRQGQRPPCSTTWSTPSCRWLPGSSARAHGLLRRWAGHQTDCSTMPWTSLPLAVLLPPHWPAATHRCSRSFRKPTRLTLAPSLS